jgi:AcrR family transcriptional regulator
MGRRNDHSREEIRQMALDAGTELLQQQGVAAVSARKVASSINYTVGTLYLVFENLDDLLLQINLRTLELMYDRLHDCLDTRQPPLEQLRTMAHVYLDFARGNENRWRLVYEHESHLRNDTHEQYLQVSMAMLTLVEQQLSRHASFEQEELQKQAGALWGGLHGICMLSLSGKLLRRDVPVEEMLDLFINQFIRGLSQNS